MIFSLNEYMLLSHTDLDGAGCHLVLSDKVEFDIVYHTSYNEISTHIGYIDGDITVHTKAVFITDLSFSLEDLIELVKLTKRHPHVKFVYIDHHEYNDDRFPIFSKMGKLDNLSVIHEIGTSATKLCLRVFNPTNSDLIKLVDYIDAYDIFREHDKDFQAGWFLNTIFWEFKMSGFKFGLFSENYKIPKAFKNAYMGIIEEKNVYFKDLESKNLLMKDIDASVFIGFSDRFKSWFQMDYPEYKVHILPYLSKNNISIRISSDVPNECAGMMKENMIEFVSSLPEYISGGGHKHAFGLTIEKTHNDDLKIMIAQGLAEIAEGVLAMHGEITKTKVPDYNSTYDNCLPVIEIDEDEIPF